MLTEKIMAMSVRKYIKLIAFILSFFLYTFATVGQSYPTLKFSANIRSGSSVMPIAVSNELFGGAHSVADIAERDAIHVNFRQKGMLVTVMDASSIGYTVDEVVTFMYLGADETVDNSKWVATVVVDASKGAVNSLESGNADGQVLLWDNTNSKWLPAPISNITLDSLGNLSLASSLQLSGTQKVNGISSKRDLGGVNAADSIIPTQKAVKVYIDSIYQRVTSFNFIRPTSTANWAAGAEHIVSLINSSNAVITLGYTIDNAYPGVGDIINITTIPSGVKSYKWIPNSGGAFGTFAENVRLFAIDPDLGDTAISQPFDIYPPFSGVLSPASQEICYNSSPVAMSVGTLTGSGSYSFLWKYDIGAGYSIDPTATTDTYSPAYTITKPRSYQVDVTDNGSLETITLGPINFTFKALDAGDITPAGPITLIGSNTFDLPNASTATADCGLSYRYYVTDNNGDTLVSYTQPDAYDANENQNGITLGHSVLPEATYRVYRESRWGQNNAPADGGNMWMSKLSTSYQTVNYKPVAAVAHINYTDPAKKALLNTAQLDITWSGDNSADYDVYLSIDGGANYTKMTTVTGLSYGLTVGALAPYDVYISDAKIKITVKDETTNFEAVGESFKIYPAFSADLSTADPTAICYNTTPGNLTVSNLTGSSSYSYDWQYLAAGVWTTLSAPDQATNTTPYTITSQRDIRVAVTDNTTGAVAITDTVSFTISPLTAGTVDVGTTVVPDPLVGSANFTLVGGDAATLDCGVEYRYYVTDNTGAAVPTQPDASYDANADQVVSLGASDLKGGTYRIYRESRWGAIDAPVDGGDAYTTAQTSNYVTVNYKPVANVVNSNYTSGTSLLNTNTLTINWDGDAVNNYDIYYTIDGGAPVLIKTVNTALTTTWIPGAAAPFSSYQGNVTIVVTLAGKVPGTGYDAGSESFKIYQTIAASLTIVQSSICYNSSPGEMSVTGLTGSGSYTFQWQYWDGAAWQNETGAPDADKYTPSYTISTTRRYQVNVTDNGIGGSVTTAPLDVTIAPTIAGAVVLGTISAVGDTPANLVSDVAATAGCNLEYRAYITDNTGADIPAFTQPDSWSTTANRSVGFGCSDLPAATYRVYREARWGDVGVPEDLGNSYDVKRTTSYLTVDYKPVEAIVLSDYTSPINSALLNIDAITITWSGCATQLYDIYFSVDGGTTKTIAQSGVSGNTTTLTPGTTAPFDVYQSNVLLYVYVAGKYPNADYMAASSASKVYPALTATVDIAASEICYNSSPGEMSVSGTNGSGTYTYDWNYFKASWIQDGAIATYNPSHSISANTNYKVILTDTETGATVEATKTVTIAATDAGTIDKVASEAGFPNPLVGNTSITVTGNTAATANCGLEYRAYITKADGTPIDEVNQPSDWSTAESKDASLGCQVLPEGTYRIYRQARWGDAALTITGDTYLTKLSSNYAEVNYKPVDNVQLTGLNGSDAISKSSTLGITWDGCATSYDVYYVIGANAPQLISSGVGANSLNWKPEPTINAYTSNVKILVVVNTKATGSNFEAASSVFTIYNTITVAIASAQTLCYNTTPSELIATPSGGSTTPTDYTYVWEESNDGTNWTVIPGEVTSSYTPAVQLIASKWYKATATDITTGEFNNGSVKMTVEPTPGTVVNGNENYNYASETDSVVNVVAAQNAACNAGIMYRVVIKDAPIAGTTQQIGNWGSATTALITLDPTKLNTQDYYMFREVDYDADGNSDATSTGYRILHYSKLGVTLSVPNAFTEWEINTLNAIVWANGSNDYAIYYDHDGNGSTLKGDNTDWDEVVATNATGTSTPIVLSTLGGVGYKTYSNVARVKIVDNNSHKEVISDAFTVYEDLSTVVKTISENDTICYNAEPLALSVNMTGDGGSGTYTYQWKTSNTESGSYVNITGATTNTLIPGPLTASKYYQVLVKDQGTTPLVAATTFGSIGCVVPASPGEIMNLTTAYAVSDGNTVTVANSVAASDHTCGVQYRTVIKNGGTTVQTGAWTTDPFSNITLDVGVYPYVDEQIYYAFREVDYGQNNSSDATSVGSVKLIFQTPPFEITLSPVKAVYDDGEVITATWPALGAFGYLVTWPDGVIAYNATNTVTWTASAASSGGKFTVIVFAASGENFTKDSEPIVVTIP